MMHSLCDVIESPLGIQIAMSDLGRKGTERDFFVARETYSQLILLPLRNTFKKPNHNAVCSAANGQGLLLWRYSLLVQPRNAVWFCFIAEDKIYSRMLFVVLKLLLILANS